MPESQRLWVTKAISRWKTPDAAGGHGYPNDHLLLIAPIIIQPPGLIINVSGTFESIGNIAC